MNLARTMHGHATLLHAFGYGKFFAVPSEPHDSPDQLCCSKFENIFVLAVTEHKIHYNIHYK
jgi:hypothetical protein